METPKWGSVGHPAREYNLTWHRNHYREQHPRPEQYGLSMDEYVRMLVEQDCICPICGLLFNFEGTRKEMPCIEHDHRSGKVRGIVCHACNVKLGVLESPLFPKLEAWVGGV